MKKNIIKYVGFALGGVLLFCVIVFYPEKNKNEIEESKIISLAESTAEIKTEEAKENIKNSEYIKLKDDDGNDIELENNKITILINDETEEYILTEKDRGKTFDEIAVDMGYSLVNKDDIETIKKGEETVKKFVESELNLDNVKVSSIQDNYTSSISEHDVHVVAEPEPEPETEPETTQASTELTEPQAPEPKQQVASGYTDSTVNLSGISFPVLSGFADINNSKFGADTDTDNRLYNAFIEFGKRIKIDLENNGEHVIADNPIYILNNKIIYDLGGGSSFELEKNNDYYKINLYVNIFSDDESYAKKKSREVLKSFCYAITNNAEELYRCIDEDYKNEILNIGDWNNTDNNFVIKVEEDKINHTVSYLIKSK